MDESHINHHANGRLGESEALLPPASSTAEAEAETTIHNAQNVERLEPAVHGQHVNWASAYILIVSRMLGSGVFASPGVVTRSAGSIGLSLSVWVFGAFMAACGASISLEYGCMLPRSGGDKVYLEYVYRRPRFLASTLITVKTILQTATANNCIVFGEYFVHALPIEPNETRRKLSALGLLLFTGILHGFFIRPGILVQNVLGWLKIAIMIFTALTSLYVLARGLAGSDRQHSQRPAEMNHENVWTTMWKGSHWTWDLVSLALFRVYYAYAGLDNANMVLNEVQNPVGMLKRVVPCSLISVTVLYVLINSAFFLVIPLDIIKEKGEMAATEFFERIMGQNIGSTIVPFLIAFSVAGNVMVAVFSLSRLNQEIARQGFLPLVFASSPLGGVVVTICPAALYILLLPSSNIYALLLDTDAYASQFFAVALVCGLISLRWTHADLRRPFRAWRTVIFIHLSICLALTTSPVFSARSASEEYLGLPSGFYALFGVAIILGATMYWFIWAHVLPTIRRQTLEEQHGVLSNGTTYTAIVSVAKQ